jgi:AraC family transcriptional regulator, glycine betaine-responsive activator
MLFESSDETLDITILLLPDASLMSLAATLDPMRAANRTAARELYRWRLVSLDGSAPVTTCGLPIPVEGRFAPKERCDILIVVSAFNVFSHCTPAVLHAIHAGARNAGMTGGVEAGAWVLALAGLLDGRRATTHWEDLEEFAARFPQVDVQRDRWVIDGPVFTTGGAMPALDLMLALIRMRQGYSTAMDVASVYIYEQVKNATDEQPFVSVGRIGQTEPRVGQAIRLMEQHIDRPLPVGAIASRVGVSTRTLETLFRQSVQASPGAYYLSLRLKAARRLVVDTRMSMADTAVRTGFTSIASLSRAFRRQYGMAPTAARRQSP